MTDLDEWRRGQQIVAEARAWLGTPYMHGQAVKGLGCDCTGLIVGVLLELGLIDARPLMDAQPRIPPAGYLTERLLRCCAETDLDRRLPGDLLLFRVGGVEQHAAIYSGQSCMIHQLATINAVAEHSISPGWQERLVGVYRVKEGA